jgi:hypothetical protein
MELRQGNKLRQRIYELAMTAEEHGHWAVHLPPYYCQYN